MLLKGVEEGWIGALPVPGEPGAVGPEVVPALRVGGVGVGEMIAEAVAVGVEGVAGGHCWWGGLGGFDLR